MRNEFDRSWYWRKWWCCLIELNHKQTPWPLVVCVAAVTPCTASCCTFYGCSVMTTTFALIISAAIIRAYKLAGEAHKGGYVAAVGPERWHWPGQCELACRAIRPVRCCSLHVWLEIMAGTIAALAIMINHLSWHSSSLPQLVLSHSDQLYSLSTLPRCCALLDFILQPGNCNNWIRNASCTFSDFSRGFSFNLMQ